MKFPRLLFVGGILLSFFVEGCSWRTSSAPVSTYTTQIDVKQLHRSEYEVMEVTQGKDCARTVSLAPLPIWWVTSDALGTEGFPILSSAESNSRRGAEYDALRNSPTADFIVTPRRYQKSSYFGPWYTETCTVMQARAVRIKADGELDKRETLDVDINLSQVKANP